MKANLKYIAFLFAGSFILLALALLNKYPFVYSDTGTYLLSGIQGWVPRERPILYGLFTRHISLGYSLWLPVMVQCLLVTFLISECVQLVCGFAYYKRNTLLLLLLLSSCSALGWLSGQLLPDIFTPLVYLSFLLLLFLKNQNRIKVILLSVIFVFTIAVHNSHLLIVTAFLLIGAVVYYFFRQQINGLWQKKNLVRIAALVAVAWLVNPAVNYFYNGSFATSGTFHVFFVGRMAESGILKKVLDDHCATEDFALCKYKDNMPRTASDFIWNGEKMVDKSGGWDGCAYEYKRIIQLSFSKSEYWKMHAVEAMKCTSKQLFQNYIGSGMSVTNKEHPAWWPIALKYKSEENDFLTSMQARGELDFKPINERQLYLFLFCFGGLILIFFNSTQRRMLNRTEWICLASMLVYILLNAFITSFISTVDSRLQTRVNWMIPFFALMILYNLRERRKIKS